MVFIGTAAFLYSTHFISAATWGQGFSTWNAENFQSLLGYVDQSLSTASVIALVIGVLYLLWAETGAVRSG